MMRRMLPRSCRSASLLFVLLAGAAARAAPVTTAIKLDNFGYRPGDAKVAVFSANPGAAVQVRTPAGAVVFSVPADGGSITAKGTDWSSGHSIWWVDFSPLSAAGSYHLYSPSLAAQSYEFLVAPAVYNDVLRAAVRTFYRQRCGLAKTAAFAGPWADGAACHLADAATTAAAGSADRGALDLRGGWHDAGDYNKYVWTAAATAILSLLRAFEDQPQAFPDGDLGIPESGNGVPDVLDEVKWELDFFLKMQLPSGAVLSQTHVPGFAADSPPSADLNLRYYQDPTFESGAVFTGSCAYASRVFAAAGQAAYAATLKDAALLGWTWLQPQADPADLQVRATKAWAAAELLRTEPTLGSARSYVDAFHADWAAAFLNVSAYDTHAAITYTQTASATPATVSAMRTALGNQVDYVFASDDLYRNGMPDWSYFWGSNAMRGAYGAFLLQAAKLGASGSHSAGECRARALELLHYFHGQNPLSMVYLTNMAPLGGEHSSFQFYHAWQGDSEGAFSRAYFVGKPAAVVEPAYPYFAGTDNLGVTDGKSSVLGPAPGFVPGGPNWSYGGTAVPPGGATHPNLAYRDWNDQSDWTARTWEITENSIGYQGPYVALAAAFADTTPVDSAARSFFTLPPCRLADTRTGAPGPLGATASRTLTIAGRCGVPATAKAVALNVTATASTAAGNLRVYPSGAALPNTSTVNYSAGQTRANNALVALGSAGQLNVCTSQATGSVEFVLDVTGYFE